MRQCFSKSWDVAAIPSAAREDPLRAGEGRIPTILEAAQALYQGHRVEEITRSDARAKNLSETTTCLEKIIEEAKAKRHKAICFVTGVPGAASDARLAVHTTGTRAGRCRRRRGSLARDVRVPAG